MLFLILIKNAGHGFRSNKINALWGL